MAVIETDKPNPFHILGLPTDATNEDIVECGQELCELAESKEQALLYRWAIEQLITKPEIRLEHELYEVPSAKYEDADWSLFVRRHKRNPVNLSELIKMSPPPQLEDFNLVNLIQLILNAMMRVEEPDIKPVIGKIFTETNMGTPPLEVRDVIFG